MRKQPFFVYYVEAFSADTRKGHADYSQPMVMEFVSTDKLKSGQIITGATMMVWIGLEGAATDCDDRNFIVTLEDNGPEMVEMLSQAIYGRPEMVESGLDGWRDYDQGAVNSNTYRVV